MWIMNIILMMTMVKDERNADKEESMHRVRVWRRLMSGS